MGTPQWACSFAHGVRGAVTSTSTVPMRQRSPSSAPVRSIPVVRRFSPNRPGRQLAVELRGPPVGVLLGVGVERLPLAAVELPVDLHVAVQTEPVDGDPAGHRPLVDGALGVAGAGQADGTRARDADRRDAAGHFLEAVDSLVESAATKASWGTSTRPTIFIRFLPSFCFSSSFRLRVMSPP